MVAIVSFHLVFLSDIFKEDPHNPIILLERKSQLSVSIQGVYLFPTFFTFWVPFILSFYFCYYYHNHLIHIYQVFFSNKTSLLAGSIGFFFGQYDIQAPISFLAIHICMDYGLTKSIQRSSWRIANSYLVQHTVYIYL
jgi:hypothetical protein